MTIIHPFFDPNSRWYYPLRWLVLILLGLAIYAQTFGFNFEFDDLEFIVNNYYITRFDHVHYIWKAFSPTRAIGFYSFAFNYLIDQLHPQGYHIFNFIVHLVAAGLVWALADLLFRITKWLPAQDRITRELPFIIAVIFLVHPCQTQAVTYITQRFESMATVFYLGTVYFYLRARVSTGWAGRIIFFGLAGVLTILGFLTKEVVVTVPVMVLACEWILFPSKDNKMIYIVLAVEGVLFYLLFPKFAHANLAGFFRPMPSESHDGDILTPAHYFLTQMRVFLTFLRLLALPVHQNLDYDYPASTGLLDPPLTLVGAGVILGFVILIIKLRRSAPLIAFGLAWVLITFSINLAPRANVIFEHKLYLISFGFFLSTVCVLSAFIKDRKMLFGLLIALVAVLALASYNRNQVWRDDLTLWNDTVQKSPHKARPHYNRGLAYYKLGDLRQALLDYSEAIEINPNLAEAYTRRGKVYEEEGKLNQALSDYNEAIVINPNIAGNYYDRGLIFAKQGNFTQAMSDFNKAIKINPRYAEAYVNRGIIFAQRSDLARALSDYDRAIEINPNDASAYTNRGTFWAQQGGFIKALADYNKALQLDPGFEEAYLNRAISYYQLKEYDKAWGDVHKAEGSGGMVNPNFIKALKQVSGRDQ